MKIIKALLAVLLCLTLALPYAVAEDAYIPGEISKALIKDAWNSGKMLNADVKFRLDLDGEAMGFHDMDQQIMDAIHAVLDAATLNLAAGKIEKGIRLEAGAALENAQSGDDVTADIAANIDLYGVSLESSLLPGRKVTAKWETLMAMAGMSDADISMMLALRDVDWAVMLPQLFSMLEDYLNMAMQFAAPYVETIAEWTTTLATEEFTDVAAADSLPAAAKATHFYLCEKDVGNLIAALADTLEKDTTLTALADMLLAQAASELGEDAPSVAELIAGMRETAEGMTDTQNPIIFTLGEAADGTPLYSEMYFMDSTNAGIYGSLISAPAENGATYAASLMGITAEGTVSDGVSLEIVVADQTVNTLFQAFVDGAAVLGVDHSMTITGMTTAEGQPGVSTEQTMTVSADDGSSTVQMLMNNTAVMARTADGGETTDVTVAMDMYMEGTAVTVQAVGGMSLFPAADGFTGSYGVTETMPAMGLNNAGFDAMLSTSAYDPADTAALAETAFETSSADTMEALATQLSSAVQAKASEVLAALPADVQALLLGQ